MFTGPLFEIKLHLILLLYSVDFKTPRKLWNPLSKAITGKFHGSAGHSECNFLQQLTNFYMSPAWQIVIFFNTQLCSLNCPLHWNNSSSCSFIETSTWPLHASVIKSYSLQWASCQIREIAGAHAPGMPGTFSPSPQVSDPDMHHGTCVTHVPWCMPGSLTSSFLWNRWRGKTFPAFPAHAQPAILRIW